LTIPLHPSLAPGTLQAIYRQATRFIPEADLRPHFYTGEPAKPEPDPERPAPEHPSGSGSAKDKRRRRRPAWSVLNASSRMPSNLHAKIHSDAVDPTAGRPVSSRTWTNARANREFLENVLARL